MVSDMFRNIKLIYIAGEEMAEKENWMPNGHRGGREIKTTKGSDEK